MRRRARSTRVLALVALLLPAATGVLAGCGEGASGPGTRGEPDLTGRWVLVSGTDAEGSPLALVPGRDVTLDIEAGKGEVGGTSACNHYFATLTQEGARVGLTGVGSTEMGCEPGVMELESRYHAALAGVDHAERTAGTLTLSGSTVGLVYETVAPTPDADLVGTTWGVESLLDGDTASSTVTDTGGAAWLRLAAAGRLHGSTGCRVVSGEYAVDGDTISLAGVAFEEPPGACPEPLLAQDTRLREMLEGDLSASVAADRLTLLAPDGRGLALRAQEGTG